MNKNNNLNGIILFNDDESFLEMMELLEKEFKKKENKGGE